MRSWLPMVVLSELASPAFDHTTHVLHGMQTLR